MPLLWSWCFVFYWVDQFELCPWLLCERWILVNRMITKRTPDNWNWNHEGNKWDLPRADTLGKAKQAHQAHKHAGTWINPEKTDTGETTKYLCKRSWDEIQKLNWMLMSAPILEMCEITVSRERSISENGIRVKRKRNAEDFRGFIRMS